MGVDVGDVGLAHEDQCGRLDLGQPAQGGGLRRFFLGDTYRDLWATPIRVPVLDIGTFAGGLTPTRRGGGNQTKSVRFEDKNGNEYVFRLVDKDNLSVPDGFEGTIVQSISAGRRASLMLSIGARCRMTARAQRRNACTHMT